MAPFHDRAAAGRVLAHMLQRYRANVRAGSRFAVGEADEIWRDLAAWRKGAKRHHGTVGAVALDCNGNLAAATSTGGHTGKLPGRVGDSPIIGAGTYADNSSCAVSGTGWGEAFIRLALAYDVSARMRYRGDSLGRAAAFALARIKGLGADGGLVALDRRGNIAMPFNSRRMLRACVHGDGRRSIKIYR